MNAQAFLEYVVAIAVIILAVISIGVGVAIMLFIYEARKAVRTVQKTAKSINTLKERVKNIFQKKLNND